MSGNLIILPKWLPPTIVEYEGTFRRCKSLKIDCFVLINDVVNLTDLIKTIQHPKFSHTVVDDKTLPMKDIEHVCVRLEYLVDKFNGCFEELNITKVHTSVNKKLKMFKQELEKCRLQLCFILQELICHICYLFVYYGDAMLVVSLRIATWFNTLLEMDHKFNLSKKINNVCNNTCPYLMFPLRKFSVTRLLQILSFNRAEYCCHKLIDCLLETYKMYETSEDDNSSEHSSLEIYMALTKHLSPPLGNEKAQIKADKSVEVVNMDESISSFVNLEELMSYEEANVLNLVNVTQQISPEMLGKESMKKTINGECRVSGKVIQKVLEYYEKILWAEVGNYLEHVILWWACSPLSARPPSSSQHLREWINQFVPTADVPSIILSTLTSLADALGDHVTLTRWDECFRKALVASRAPCNPDSGQLYCNLLQELVSLSNSCEVTPEWIVGAPLDELPLVEQIPVLHRLDHSIHIARLWAMNECRNKASEWNVEAFFAITHIDIVNCLGCLNDLKLTDHSARIEKGGLDVHVEVCTLMRAKLVSEIQANIQKLKDTTNECVSCLASICKVTNLAHLKMIFPPKQFWKMNGSEIPDIPCPYVAKYLDTILTPVLKATDNDTICNMILTLVCESWLDHIYMNKIKFSEWGAFQLLCDFAYITTWIQECPIITEFMRKKLSKNEVLRRCEGVGRLLLRCPGEKLKMVDKKLVHKKSDNESDEEDQHQEMPAEMYVPNQEQWLELRALKKRVEFNNPFCC